MTVLDQLTNTSVRFNGLLIPAKALESTLGRYVDNLIVWNNHDVHKISLVGSAVPLLFGGRYFLICTNHQLAGRDPENVSIMGRDGQKLVTSSGMRCFSDETLPHYLDLAAFDFTEPCEVLPDSKKWFFVLRDIPPDTTNSDIVAVVVAGFPAADQKYEVEEANHIGKVKRIVVCQPEPSSKDSALLCLYVKDGLGFNPDGMSGGSAFVIQQIGAELHAFFAGMIVTAGKDRFHIIKVGPIKQFLTTLL
jgi:hypothetical protein